MDACLKSRVSGFVYANGKKIYNGRGEEILLRGPGLGNWLLPEGYMWGFKNLKNKDRVDRPRRIEQLLIELAGKEYTEKFWKDFQENYITEKDIIAISDAGFNSLRIAVNSRVLIEDGISNELVENGFKLIDRCLDWCEKHSIYAIIDLHGAPGGQTGANIDDCIDDMPRLFMDQFSYNKCIILWKAIAQRYKDREIIAAYDLLNEPLQPLHFAYKEKLMDFYTDVIKEIRYIDKRHMLSIEGAKWATDTEIFERHYDDNMIIHFHRYWCPPDENAYEEFLALSEKLNAPLWLGESGENSIQWYGTMFPLAIKLNVSWNFWPWKRMCTDNPTICEITSPKGWDKILNYIDGGNHPGYEECQTILNEYIENIKFENLTYRKDVVKALISEYENY
jgi:endoglucanase